MGTYQQTILFWIGDQPWLTGLVILAAGLLSAFCGYRMARLLLPAAAAAGAWLGTIALAPHWNLPEVATAAAAAGLAGAAGLAWPGFASVAGGAVIWGVLGGYLFGQFGLKGTPLIIGLALSGAAGAVLALVCRRTMVMLMTSITGAALIIVGAVGVSGTLLPAFSNTFRLYARDWPWSVPVLLSMLVMMAYSCQANYRQGDLRTGGTGEISGAVGV